MKSKLHFVLTAITVLSFSLPGRSQAPNLGSASSYALFTSAGAFNAIGPVTEVTGNVGNYTGAFNAFPPGILHGQQHVADATAFQVAADIDAAYNYLGTVSCDSVISTTLGSGQVLTPKVYCLGAASVLNGNLILDGGGDPNALFIFKINGALSSSALSNIILINSASANNVYWQINGSVSLAFGLGDSSVFRGTILANGAISLSQGSILYGRGLSLGGAISLQNNIIKIHETTDCENYGNGTAQNITYVVNGNPVSSLTGHVSSGDVLQVCFTLNAGVDPTIFSLVSYTAPGSIFDANTAYLQTVYDMESHTFSGTGAFCMTVRIPDCYFQVDFVKGCVITELDNGNFYSTTGRLIDGENGGSGICNCVATADAGMDFSLSCNSSEAVLYGSTFVQHPVISWTAHSGGTISSGANTLNPIITTAGVYVLSVTDTLGCTAMDSVHVTGHTNVLTPGVIGYDQIHCGPFIPDTLFSVTDATANPGETITYQWLSSPENVPNTYGNPYWVAIPGANSANYIPAVMITDSTYYIRCARTIGCTFTGNTTEGNIISAIVLNQINSALGNDTTICAGFSITLDAGNPGMNFNWSTGETTQTISVSATGTYSVTISSGICTTSDTIHLTVVSYPVVDLGNDTILCAGGNIVLDAGNPGMNFLWNTGETTQTISANSTGTYSVTVSNGMCSVSGDVHITILPPLTFDLGNDTTVALCVGFVTLDAGISGMTYTWSTGATTQTTNVSTTGTYSLTITNSIGCTASDNIHVTINPATINVSLGNDTVLCAGENVTLNAGNPGMNFIWNNGETTQTIVADTTGTYSVLVSSGICIGSDDIHVTVLPALTMDLGNDTTVTFCNGSLTLDAGNSGMNYLWSTGEFTQTINVTSTGTYFVTVMNSGGCMISDNIHVTIIPAAISVDLGNDTLLCAGGNMMLDAGNAGASFLWNTGAATQTITANTTGTYSVTITSGICSASDSVHVTVLPMLIVDLGNDTTVTFCTGSLTLDAGNSGMNYLWNTGATTQTIAVSTTGTYSVTVTNSGGCMSSGNIHVTVIPAPLHVDLGSDTVIINCHNDSIMLDAGNAGSSYMWSTGATTQTIFVSATGTYSVTVMNSGGCTASDSIHILIYGGMGMNLGPDITVCGCTTLNAYVTGGTDYHWCNGGFYPTMYVCSSGLYCVTVSNGVCTLSDTIIVTVDPLPIVHLGNDTTFRTSIILNAGNAGSAFLWNNGATTQTIIVNTPGQYFVRVTNSHGCVNSDTINVRFSTGIAENIIGDLQVSIFPNPSSSSKGFNLNFVNEESGTVEIRILNILGLVVYSEKIENFKGEFKKNITLENSSPGIYVADILIGNKRSTRKVVLE